MVVNNPNNWHWVDKNCIDWSRQYFKDHLTNVTETLDDQSVAISSLKSIEGDVVVSQRKGKIISLFDVKLVLDFQGSVGQDIKTNGTITVPEVAYDTEKDEYQFEISVFSENSDNTKIREVIRKKLIPRLRDLLYAFGKDLLAENGSDIQLPPDQVKSQFTKANQIASSSSAGASSSSGKASGASTASNTTTSTTSTTTSTTGSGANVPKYNTSTLHLNPVFNTTAEQLYLTLLEKNRIGAWTRSLPDFQGDVLAKGSKFNLFGGNVQGEIVDLVPNAKIVQSWRLNDWKTGHYANLTIELHQGDGETTMDVLFKGIPIGEEDAVQANFEDYYIRSIKITFGFGAVL